MRPSYVLPLFVPPEIQENTRNLLIYKSSLTIL